MLHSVAIIAVAAIVTLIIRAVPFVAFGGKREVPETVTYLGKVLPPEPLSWNSGIVVYCRGGIASYLEEKYVAEYSCRDHTLYDISASSILKQCEKAFFQPFHTVFLRN